ncbi:uncharacterized protein EV422DRAFT_349626 [Fimicolochytrium jonesii]|uniref:uncharacterized protein n=1 Tax=Fimicolochytrium jonesii TaxID=1396493 RepID=UPI0022FF0248|nr:uncharacterized protein EV422DRAFT_349626 [Fimicolochytrium jonesii]KAI8815617.1 hypothetical protein EV422DRAFT_349626 [Fimicolochytrium jonesii]
MADKLELIEEQILLDHGNLPISCIVWGVRSGKPFVLVTVDLPRGMPVELPRAISGIDILLDYGTMDLFHPQQTYRAQAGHKHRKSRAARHTTIRGLVGPTIYSQRSTTVYGCRAQCGVRGGPAFCNLGALMNLPQILAGVVEQFCFVGTAENGDLLDYAFCRVTRNPANASNTPYLRHIRLTSWKTSVGREDWWLLSEKVGRTTFHTRGKHQRQMRQGATLERRQRYAVGESSKGETDHPDVVTAFCDLHRFDTGSRRETLENGGLNF